jgi:hypothetical protein
MAKEYNISRATGVCHACEKQFEPGEEFTATVRETGEELSREDYCPPCWEAKGDQERNSPELLGVWRTRTPQPKEKKKVFVDDEVLLQFFERLDGTDDESRIAFRFVLTLVLMQKNRLAYEGTANDDQGRDVWKMRVRGEGGRRYKVVDPHLDEDRIAEVSQQLGQILEGEL